METKVKIVHDTYYQFGAQVFIDPHYLRFKPKVTPNNHLEEFELSIFPIPAGMSEQNDAENNLIHFCWFDQMYDSLSIRSTAWVVLKKNNPFDFILYPPDYFQLPFQYDLSLHSRLSASLQVDRIDNPLIEYGNLILWNSGSRTVDFITNLTQQIFLDFSAESRLIGPPHDSNLTFHIKRGSCRDLSWMQIQLLRYMGIASRFVSGYFIPTQNMQPELHGWVEVYLPGAGWLGFDPSHGCIASHAHIPVCTSSQYQNTMPVTGSFKGNTTSVLTTNLTIEEVVDLPWRKIGTN